MKYIKKLQNNKMLRKGLRKKKTHLRNKIPIV